MNQSDQDRKWYQKKRYIGPLALAAIFVGSNVFSTNSVSTVDQSASAIKSIAVPTTSSVQKVNNFSPSTDTQTLTKVKTTEDTPAADSNLSNNNYYTNSTGNEVPSPAYSKSVPEGASAQCGDGTYSFSQSRRGTCSHHGGVATWNP